MAEFDLSQKVGPLPLWAWLGAGGVIFWYFQRQQKSSTSASTGKNQQTDPAGNVGSIDPSTGYVYGTPEDQAALAQQNAGSASTGTSSGTNATTGAQTYADNNTWGIAAINYLVGLGIDATTANQAIQQYLSSQSLTTAEQGDVNLAIQRLGPPPSLPGPVTTSPPPVTTPPGGGGGGGAGNKPSTVSNGHVVSLNNNDAVIAWDHAGPATSWRVTRIGPGGTQTNVVSVPQATYSGLQAGHNYEVTVQPLPTGQSGVIHFLTTSGPGH